MCVGWLVGYLRACQSSGNWTTVLRLDNYHNLLMRCYCVVVNYGGRAGAATAAGGYFMDIDCSDDARKYPSVQYSVLRAFIEFRSV